MQFTDIKDHILPLVEKPNRYVSNELNVIRKDHDQVKLSFALCFPDTYEIGMSHLGFKILYHILNKRDDVVAERAFAPWVDMENLMRHHQIPLFSHETYTPLRDFDILGFTLQYELSYTNILNMLDLAQVPVLAAERTGTDPLVIAGGPCASNTEPIHLFVDAVLIGEGEDAVHDIVDAIIAAKAKALSREETLFEIAQIEGMYVPRFYDQLDDGQIVPNRDGIPETVKRRFVPELRYEDIPTDPVVPSTGVIHERAMIEVMRGCTVGCRFCHAGMYYRPVRERSASDVIDLTKKVLKSTGYDNVSLISLSSADYTCVADVVQQINEAYGDDKISISLPSLRPDVFTVDLADGVSSVKKSGLTFALEAGTQRLRDVINKPNSEEALFRVAEDAFKKGWQTVKLYFMIGLPTETTEDLDGIVRVINTVYRLGRQHGKGRITINATISPFVPKPHTPFQWEAQDTIRTFYKKVHYLESKLTNRNINVKYHAPHGSYLECVLARGDRRVSEVVYQAWRKGCRFDAWDEFFRFDTWLDTFAELGVDPDEFTQEHTFEQHLPWDHIDIHARKKFLWKDRQKAYENAPLADCRWEKCHACGVPRGKTCNVLAGVHPVMGESVDPPFAAMEQQLISAESLKRTPAIHRPLNGQLTQRNGNGQAPKMPVKYRFKLTRDERFRFISHRDFMEIINKALRRSELPLAYTQGYSPRPKISFGPSLPLGMSSFAEYFDLQLNEEIDHLRDRFNRVLPDGIAVQHVKLIAGKVPSLSAVVDTAVYTVAGLECPTPHQVESFLAQDEIWVERNGKKKRRKSINIRPLIHDITVQPENGIWQLVLETGNQGHGRPDEILLLLSDISAQDILKLQMVRTDLLIRQEDHFLTPMDII
ncbi:MAG: TIGR03960 family B12-binding radical SAM protein [Gemmatimonadetes bacterium]|nr:MAG: TIGR03960 family B12-binding radical SAM protein [Gemmatimonadota bacterium]